MAQLGFQRRTSLGFDGEMRIEKKGQMEETFAAIYVCMYYLRMEQLF